MNGLKLTVGQEVLLSTGAGWYRGTIGQVLRRRNGRQEMCNMYVIETSGRTETGRRIDKQVWINEYRAIQLVKEIDGVRKAA